MNLLGVQKTIYRALFLAEKINDISDIPEPTEKAFDDLIQELHKLKNWVNGEGECPMGKKGG